MSNYNDGLKHYGVKGMRWGFKNVNRNSNQGSSSGFSNRNIRPVQKSGFANRNTKPSLDARQAMALRKKNVNTLSNKQLMSLNKRMQLEKQRADLVRQTSAYGKGKSYAAEVTATLGTAAAIYGFSQSPLGRQIIGSLKPKK